VELRLDSGGTRLNATLAKPSTEATQSHGLVVCHAFPASPDGTALVDPSYAELGTALAAATSWTVLTFDLRPAKTADGGILVDWLGDLTTAIDHVLELDEVDGVWLAGFGLGGGLALCAAGQDERVRGVATFAAPAEFDDWFSDPITVRPLQSVSKVPPRPLLLVHGDADDVVPVSDARALADAAGGEVELRIVAGAGHGLRHDPRATAVLEGWLDRQTG
jgi:putative redox protein